MSGFILDTIAAIWLTAGAMAPYLLLGFLIAGLLSVFIRPETVERHLGRRGFWSILKAAAFGVPLPLCSCGVIPVSASLRRHGASKGATTAFLISTPQTGVDSIAVTYSLLGLFFAIFRPLIALVTGAVGGALVDVAEGKDGTGSGAPEPCEEPCCTTAEGRGKLAQVVRYGFVNLPRDIARPLLFGLVIAGVISAVAPKPELVRNTLGTGIIPMLVVMAFAIPLYVCATASVPLAAALIHAGFTPGAALVFLMAGPATNAATVATIWKVLGRRTAAIYLLVIAVAAVGAGMLLDGISAGLPPDWRQPPHHEMVPIWFRSLAALALFTVLANALRPSAHAKRATIESPPDLELAIGGMHCEACAETIRRALLECPKVVRAQVSLDRMEAYVWGEALDYGTLLKTVGDLGYTARTKSTGDRHGERQGKRLERSGGGGPGPPGPDNSC